jgi:TPP-dependent pyruvate/acetoin dehydrogenase alpha subunit
MKKLTKVQLLKLYSNMKRTKIYDVAMIKLTMSGQFIFPFYHSSEGHESVGVGAASFLRDDDYMYMAGRGHGLPYAIGKGIDPRTCIYEHLGKANGWGGGLSGVHFADRSKGVLGLGGTVGSAHSLSVGYGLAAKKNGRQQVAVCFSGDGGMQRGTVHEAMNMAAVWKLPVVWVVENNDMAWFTPRCDSWAADEVADLAKAYNIPGIIVDGMDVEAVHYATQEAVERARAGEGPSLLDCKVHRVRSHSEGRPDVAHCTPRCKKEIAKWKKKDPVITFEKKLLKDKVLTKKKVEALEKQIEAEIEEAVKIGKEAPLPDPAILDKIVYAD